MLRYRLWKVGVDHLFCVATFFSKPHSEDVASEKGKIIDDPKTTNCLVKTRIPISSEDQSRILRTALHLKTKLATCIAMASREKPIAIRLIGFSRKTTRTTNGIIFFV